MNPRPAPRLREANRFKQIPSMVLDKALPDDHPARTIWAYVTTINLDAFLEQIRAVKGQPGRNATDPRILLAVWMYAIVDGVGSARWLAELCQHHIAYRWLCGGVSLNHHILSDFRVSFEEELDQLLKDHVSALMQQGLVDLKRVAQDGMRVRANAGAASFRRGQTIEECQKEVAEQLALLKDQADDPPGSAAARSRAARQRHLEEKTVRLEEAKKVAAELEAKRAHRLQEHPKEAAKEAGKDPAKKAGRGSTTDPEARQMKMPDGGYRPAYNVQAASTTAEGLIVGIDVTKQGTDAGLMGPMIGQIEESYGKPPEEMLNDGGFMSVEDVEAAAAKNVDVYMPLRDEKKELAAGKDPYAAKKGDKAGMKGLRTRMGTQEAKKIYKERASTAEWVNAGMRNRGLYQFLVRGVRKVRAVVLMQALVHNLFTTIRLCSNKKLVRGWTEILRAGLKGIKKEGQMVVASG
jgi:transposase